MKTSSKQRFLQLQSAYEKFSTTYNIRQKEIVMQKCYPY